MNKFIAMLAILVVLSAVFASGCTSQGTAIIDEESAGDAVEEVSENIEDAISDLDNIDEELGG